MDAKEARREVEEYLDLCAQIPHLNRRYHPTPEGAVKVIRCRDKAEETLVKNVYAEAVRRGNARPVS